MENRDYIIILYDYYGELFNDNQKKYFELYYFDNLSLSEIAENENKSRNAIHKVIKNVANKLIEYENILHVYEKENKIKAIVDNLDNKEIKRKISELL